MIVLPKFPSYASGNRCFITKRTELEEGDRVVCTDIDADSLPTGTLCLHSNTVKMMVAALGWELRTPDDDAALLEMQQEIEVAKERLIAFEILLGAIDNAIETITKEPA